MTFSIIQKSQLENFRLDAEFYQAEYFIDFTKSKWESVADNFNCQYGLSLAMNDEKTGYPMYKMDDINGCFLMSDEVRFARVTEAEYKTFKLNENDVLFNRVNSEEFVGRTGIFKNDIDGIFASYLIRLTSKPDSKILPDYLNSFLNSQFGLKQIKRYSRRAVNQANINAEELKKFKIALIPIQDQELIRKLSNDSWNEIQNSKKFYHQAEDLLLKELGLKDFNEENKLFSIVNLSEVQKFGRIDAEYFLPKYLQLQAKLENISQPLFKLIENIPAKFEPTKEPNKEFKYVELANINSSNGLIDDYAIVLGKVAPSRARRIIKVGDVIVSSVEGSLNKVALVKEEQGDYLASTGFFQFRSDKILPEALLVLMKSIVMQWQLKQNCAGTILTAVPCETLNKMHIPILKTETQQKIADLVRQSHTARQKSKELLDEAKRKVEEMIEKE